MCSSDLPAVREPQATCPVVVMELTVVAPALSVPSVLTPCTMKFLDVVSVVDVDVMPIVEDELVPFLTPK